MDQTIRNKLRNVVTQCRKLLEDSTAQALQGRFGIYAARKKGEVHIEDEARMAHLTEEDRACRQDLLDHLEHIQAIGYKPSEALEQLVREIAFTHLNRLCAYKMMESRGLIREAVSRGLKSQGFFFYLADHPEDEKLHNGGGQETAYRNFLDWLGGTLSQEIGVLFNPNDPANRIYPAQRVLDDVLALINDGDLKNIWSQDETIGWVYQYFTPKELRDKARKESQTPRNSYELAFRNQFFTPRYVVEFLTDNTLGRIWYEMRKGKTILKDRCKYLVRRPTEIFLKEGEDAPPEPKDTREDLSQEELLKQPVYITHRSKKDPREIKVLDPACGSGHFLLYCFDLLQVIYEEAYDEPDLGAALRSDYPAIEDLRRAVPGLILKHNLHGIDIDLRATQIAALALWLRCQRAYQELGLKNGERPKITRSNIVCAEPMPGEEDMRREFTAGLKPRVLGQIVDEVFEKMKLAGEAGSLLKIEEEIKDAVAAAGKQWREGPKPEQQLLFLPGMTDPRPKPQELRFDVKGITDERFWDHAEDRILDALKDYAEQAENGRAVRRRLFAEDTARGFAFIDLCRKRYDVVLMNPPYGDTTERVKRILDKLYSRTRGNLYTAFIERVADLLFNRGLSGALTERMWAFQPSFRHLREQVIFPSLRPQVFLDLMFGVLDDAFNRTAAYVLEKDSSSCGNVCFIDLRRVNEKETALNEVFAGTFYSHPAFCVRSLERMRNYPGCMLLYSLPPKLEEFFVKAPKVGEYIGTTAEGRQTSNDDRFVRAVWEVPYRDQAQGNWISFAKGGYNLPFYRDSPYVAKWDPASQNHYLCTGSRRVDGSINKFKIGWSDVASCLNFQSMPLGQITSPVNQGIVFYNSAERPWLPLGYLNARLPRAIAAQYYDGHHWQPGIVCRIPYPINDLKPISSAIIEQAKSASETLIHLFTKEEEARVFVAPEFANEIGFEECLTEKVAMSDNFESSLHIINMLVESALNLDEDTKAFIEEAIAPFDTVEKGEVLTDRLRSTAIQKLLSWCVGVAFGRWDVRIALDPALAPKLPDPFDPLPVCPPGMLVGPDGLPAEPNRIVSEEWLSARPDANTLPPDGSVKNPTIPDSEYPLRISWDGVLVDDPGHENDIVRRVRDVLEVIWKDRAEAIEREACEILGVRELRDYFRKPGNGGFWMDHVKRYSKSRRKAPIYWYLRSTKGNYGLWLYYHRLDKDILFKALLNYVEPKIRLEEDRLRTLRGRKESAGSSGREAKQIEKDMDRQEQLVSELHDFADKLRRAANLHLVPDLNDGVVLTIAPLVELVPWKEAKEYWEDLVAGKYEWSSIGKQMREKGLVKK
jgi:hypothetical protein